MKKVMLIAGEASGDAHTAELVKSVLKKNSNIQFYGIGGQAMRQAGVDIHIDAANLAVVGLWEVLAHRKVIFAALDKMRELLTTQPPDLLVLIDYAEFNLKLAEHAKKCGVKVLFYISPQVWAWRQKRVYKIKQRVDMMAVIFPFEKTFYDRHNVPARYVGHPLSHNVTAALSRSEFLDTLNINPQHPVLGLFPGSRHSEIKRLLPVILESAKQLKQHITNLEFILPLASTLELQDIKAQTDKSGLNIHIIADDTYNVIHSCNAIVSVSGTVTLEIALIGTPLIIINRVSWLTYLLVKRMIKISYIGLCNIVADKQVAKELIQYQATTDNICAELLPLLTDNNKHDEAQKALGVVKQKLVDTPAEISIADLTLEMLSNG